MMRTGKFLQPIMASAQCGIIHCPLFRTDRGGSVWGSKTPASLTTTYRLTRSLFGDADIPLMPNHSVALSRRQTAVSEISYVILGEVDPPGQLLNSK
jgi:hypothetical protein